MLANLRFQHDETDLIVTVSMPLANLPKIVNGREVPRGPGDPAEDHRIVIPLHAIKNRMAFYGLSTPEEAVTAILREHHHRLNQSAPPKGRKGRQDWRKLSPVERGMATGGLDDTISVPPVVLPQSVLDDLT